MTEAELQRLAALITELSPDQPPLSANFWQLLIAFLAGVLVNGATDLIRWWAGQRQKLREARVGLYRALSDYRWFLVVNDPGLDVPLSEETIRRAKQLNRDEVWQRILEAISAGNDRKYGRLIFDKLRYPVFESSDRGRASEFRAVSEIIERLEPEALALTERLHDEYVGRMRKRWLANSRRRKR